MDKIVETELARGKGLLKTATEKRAVETELKRGKRLVPERKFNENHDEQGRFSSGDGGGGGDSRGAHIDKINSGGGDTESGTNLSGGKTPRGQTSLTIVKPPKISARNWNSLQEQLGLNPKTDRSSFTISYDKNQSEETIASLLNEHGVKPSADTVSRNLETVLRINREQQAARKKK